MSRKKDLNILLATADANAITDEELYTATCCPRTGLGSITVENVNFIRVIEIIFCLKNMLSNENNYGWLNRTNRFINR